MSEKKDILSRLDEAAKEYDDPVLDGVRAVASEVVNIRKNAEARDEEIETKVDGIKSDLVKETNKTKAQLEAGFRMAEEKFDALERRFSVTNRGLIASSGDDLLAAIPEDKRHLVRQADTLLRSGWKDEKSSVFCSPESLAFAAHWLQTSVKSQSRQYAGQHATAAAELEKLAQCKAAYAEGTTTAGGNLVPTIVAGDILRIVQDNAVVYSRASKIPMATNNLKIPNESTGVTIYWSAEAATLTQGEGAFGQNSLVAKKLIGRAQLSREIIDDSVVGVLPYLQGVFAEAFARELDQEAIEGDGTNFTGVNAASGVNSVATTTTNGEALTYGDLVSLVYQATDQSSRSNAAFFMHPQIFATVVNLVDSNGQPIFQYANVPGSSQMTILGYPVHLTSALSVAITRGSTGNTGNVYFGDPRKLIYGVKMDMRFEVTDQASWATDEFDCRMIGRWGYTVATPAAWSKLVGATKIGV